MGINKSYKLETSLWYKIFSGLISSLPQKISIYILFLRRFKYFPNLKSPKTFNEKIQVKKLSDRSTILTTLADKIECKKFVEEKKLDIYIPKILWKGQSFNNLDINILPSQYVIKSNHASRTNIIIKNNKHLQIAQLNKIKNEWFNHNQYSTLGEWAYKNIKKQVFIEEYLEFNNTSPDDYKFFVYHGKVKFIQLDTGRFQDHMRNMFDENWHDLNFNYTYKRLFPPPKKPDFLEEMKAYAEVIAKGFDFLRIDFYFYKSKITFGEITIYPGAGFEKFPKKKWDLEFGKHWILK